MNTAHTPIADKATEMLDATARGARRAIDSAAHPSIDALAESVEQVRANAVPALHELAAGAEHMARSGADAVQDRAIQLRDASAAHVRVHPLQTVLIAIGVGAAAALLTRLVFSHDDRSR